MDFYSNNYDLLTNSERSLLHYILDHPQTIQKMTCRKLADQCGVSKTVVINMSQKLGFEGYNDLRFFLKNRAKKTGPAASVETVEAEITGNVTKTMQLNKPENMRQAAQSIVNSQCVYVISRGTSKAVGNYLEHLLLTLNVKCINIPDYNLLNIIARQMTHEEVLIAISLSGKTPIIVETAKIVKAYGNALITLTAFSNSPLVQYGDLALYCSSSTTDTKIDDIVTRIGMFAVVDLLVHYVQVEQQKSHRSGF
mgnify:FL=1